MTILDNYYAWEIHDAQQERWLQKRPICADCGEHIQDDHYYLIDDKIVCPDCLDSYYRREIEDY